jgi:import inner membrane translocase subunit TIM44
VEKVPDGEILKNTIKEVLTTIKDSAYEKAAGTKEAITKGATDFSSKANNVEDTATGHAIINIVKHAWRQTFPSHDDQVRERMELMKKRVAE